MSSDPKSSKDSFEISHVSDHFIKGTPGTHPISQRITVDSKTRIVYTDVNSSGDVGPSGFDKPAGSK